MTMDDKYLDQMEAHLDEGGQLSHINGLGLFNELKKVRNALKTAKSLLIAVYHPHECLFVEDINILLDVPTEKKP